MVNKLYLTIDLDAFFASCEEIKNPAYKNKPLAVGHEIKGRGIAATVNYKAREKGIKSGMPLFKARELEPNLLVATPDYEFYQQKANEVFKVILTYTDKVEVASIDECYVDATSLANKYKPIELAKKIQEDVHKKTKLWVSIGISDNLLLSKMASGMQKPQGITTLWTYELSNKLWPLPIKDLFMVGKQSSEKFVENGIVTIRDLVELENNQELFNKLRKSFGINLLKWIDEAKGRLTREVDTEGFWLKSISKEETFGNSLIHIDDVLIEARRLLKFAFKRKEIRKLNANTVHINLKMDKSFKKISASKKIERSKNDWDSVWSTAELLIDKLYIEGMSIKQIGVGFSGLKEGERTYKQLTLENINNHDENINLLQDLADEATTHVHQEVFLGSTMLENRRFEKQEPLDSDKVKLKSWEK